MSTTSDECECYSFHYENYYTSPGMSRSNFYPTLAEPLIYFAHVPPGQNKKERKSPNCFVKAFRWYTQEHVPQSGGKTVSSRDPNVAGFATWLDSKYEEYLREGGHCCSPYHRKFTVMNTQTSINEPNVEDPPCAAPKFRLKSPWRKRRYCNNTNTKDVECRVDGSTHRSLVYILEPKELTRPASDCCHPTQTPCCSEYEICKSRKSLVKSKSATNVPQVRLSVVPPVDQVQIVEGDKIKKNNKRIKKEKKDRKAAVKKAKDPVECQCGNISSLPAPKPDSKNAEVECLLVETNTKVVAQQNIDTQCQCQSFETLKKQEPTLTLGETSALLPTTKTMETQCNECCGCTICNHQIICPGCGQKVADMCSCLSHLTTQTAIKSINRKLSIKEDGEGIAVAVNKTMDSTVTVTQQMNEMCHCNQKVCCNCTDPQSYNCNGLLYCEPNKKMAIPTELKEVRRSSKSGITSPPLMAPRLSMTTNTCTKLLVNDTVQTSDHSICLENTVNGYPLFMRIVCADKLNEECVCKQKYCV